MTALLLYLQGKFINHLSEIKVFCRDVTEVETVGRGILCPAESNTDHKA